MNVGVTIHVNYSRTKVVRLAGSACDSANFRVQLAKLLVG
jgi:hypothetical protein